MHSPKAPRKIKIKSWSAIKTLIILNIIVFVLQDFLFERTLFQDYFRSDGSIYNYIGATKDSFGRVQYLYDFHYFTAEMVLISTSLKNWELWRIVTHMFCHGGLLHIFFNMMVLASFGKPLEMKYGKKKFLIIYFFCGLISAFLITGVNWSSQAPTLGASGAICGLVAIYAILFPLQKVYFFFIPIAIPIRKFVKYFAIFSLTMILLRFFLSPSSVKGFLGSIIFGLSHSGHLGGMLGGWIFIKYLSNFKRKPKSDKNRKAFFDINKKQQNSSMEDADAILDKMSKYGFDSLSENDKKILENARKNLRR